MIYWVLTDTHFGHTKMHEYCGRPEGFEYKILRNSGLLVGESDILIHLGDFCIGDDLVWHERFMRVCRGKKWLIRGNHDRKSLTWYLSHGWDFVADSVTLNVFGHTVILSHRPTSVPCDYVNVHGHQHNTMHHPEDAMDDRNRLVYIEHEYMPVNLMKIINRKL